MIFMLLPMFLFLTAINPLFNTQGERILFTLWGRPYTLEALFYGGAIAGIFVITMLWFGCYNQVLTGDKFTALFGNLIPSLSLLLVMVMRMIPHLIRKTKQIIDARKSIGKGISENATNQEKLSDGFIVLSTMTDWALEGSVVTGDSMRARGYGTAKRTHFQIYYLSGLDGVLITVICILFVTVLGFGIGGAMQATFTPQMYIAPVSGVNILGLIAYNALLWIPTILQIKENVIWHISKLKI